MRGLVPLAVVALALAAGCAGEEEPADPRQRPATARQQPPRGPTGVAAFVERPPRGGSASVRGRLFPLGRNRLVLSGEDVSISVVAPQSFVRNIRARGIPVVVTGPARRLDRRQASQLAELVSKRRRPAENRRPAQRRRLAVRRERIANTRTEVGDPYLVLEQASPVGRLPRRLRSLDELERRAR